MEAIIYIEIPVKITFGIDSGQKGNWDQPEYPPSIEDKDYDDKQVLEAINNEIYGEQSTIDEELWEEVFKMKDEPF